MNRLSWDQPSFSISLTSLILEGVPDIALAADMGLAFSVRNIDPQGWIIRQSWAEVPDIFKDFKLTWSQSCRLSDISKNHELLELLSGFKELHRYHYSVQPAFVTKTIGLPDDDVEPNAQLITFEDITDHEIDDFYWIRHQEDLEADEMDPLSRLQPYRVYYRYDGQLQMQGLEYPVLATGRNISTAQVLFDIWHEIAKLV